MASNPVRQKGCKSCGDPFTPMNSMAKVCSMSCSLDYARGETKKKKDEEFRELKVKVAMSDLPKQHKLTQKAFNRLVKLREFNWFADRNMEPTCISCGGTLGGDEWAAGHNKTRGSNSSLAYDFKNVFLQHNKRCNKELSGDIYGTKTTHGYLQGLKNRFGEEEGQAIIDYCDTHNEVVHWTAEKLKSMRKDFNKQIRELEGK